MREAIPPLPRYVFMAWCLVRHRDKFTFNFYLYNHHFIVAAVVIYILIVDFSCTRTPVYTRS
jgi:hypothetical protein